MNRTDNVHATTARDTREYPEFDADQPSENAGAPLHQTRRLQRIDETGHPNTSAERNSTAGESPATPASRRLPRERG